MSKMVVLSRPKSLPDCSEENPSYMDANIASPDTELSPDKKVQIMKRPSNQESDGEGGRAVSCDGNGQVKSFQEREADYIKARSRILGSSKTNGSSPPTLSPQPVSPPASPSLPEAAVSAQISSTAPAVLPQSISPPSADVSRSPPSPAPATVSPPPCMAPPASMLPQPEGWCAPQYPPYNQFMAQPYAPHVYQGNGHIYPPMPPNMMPPRMMMPVMTSQLPLCYQQPPIYMPAYAHQPPVHQMYGTPYHGTPHHGTPYPGMPPMPPSAMMSYNVDAPVFQPRQPQPVVANAESKDTPKNAKAAPKWANPKAADTAPAKGNAGESCAKKNSKDNSDSVNARGALSGKIRLKNGGNTNKAEASTGKAIEILKRKQSPPGEVEEAAVIVAEKPASEENDAEGSTTTKPKEKKKKAPRKKKSQANLNGGDKAESDEIKENDDEKSGQVTKKGKQKGKRESVNVRLANAAAVRNPLLLKDINKSANERIVRVPKGPDGTAGFNLVRDFSGISIV